MKIATLAEVRNHFSQYIAESGKEPIFITRNGHITAVMEHLAEENIEDFLLEHNAKFRKALDRSRKSRGGMDLETYRKSRDI